MILGIYMTDDSGREGCDGILEEELCPACRKTMTKEIKRDDKGEFLYLLKCKKHGIMKHRKPTYYEIRTFNE